VRGKGPDAALRLGRAGPDGAGGSRHVIDGYGEQWPDGKGPAWSVTDAIAPEWPDRSAMCRHVKAEHGTAGVESEGASRASSECRVGRGRKGWARDAPACGGSGWPEWIGKARHGPEGMDVRVGLGRDRPEGIARARLGAFGHRVKRPDAMENHGAQVMSGLGQVSKDRPDMSAVWNRQEGRERTE
jgi:hypothetical protein